MENEKVVVKETFNRGKGLFAVQRIVKGEAIAGWKRGTVYWADRCSKLPGDLKNYAVQFAENLWIDCDGIARFTNHSCEPNCGILDFHLVAMRDIDPGEEITFDYDMTENSDWRMVCRCGAPSCRGIVAGYRFLPQAVREKYSAYVAQYLTMPPYDSRTSERRASQDSRMRQDRRVGLDRRMSPDSPAGPDRRTSHDRRMVQDRRISQDRRTSQDRRMGA